MSQTSPRSRVELTSATSRRGGGSLGLYIDSVYTDEMIHEVRISRKAKKQLRRVPGRIVDALDAWIEVVEDMGLEEVRKIPGYHDEPLKGDRRGKRSVRLTIAYRAIYEILKDESGNQIVEFASVEEVTKHEY